MEQTGGITTKERSTFGLFDNQYNPVFSNKYLQYKILMQLEAMTNIFTFQCLMETELTTFDLHKLILFYKPRSI